MGPEVLSELQHRWPHLGLVPDAALLQLLEELLALFRTAWLLQQQQQQCQQHLQQHDTFLRLPHQLLDVLFRGVDALLPGNSYSPPTEPNSHDDHGAPDSFPQDAGCGSGTSASLSGCPWEPLSAAELSQGAGQLRVDALVSVAEEDSSLLSSATCLSELVHGTVLQQLDLTDSAPAGVLWSIDSCPASVLKALQAAASNALKAQLAAAVQSAATMPVRTPLKKPFETASDVAAAQCHSATLHKSTNMQAQSHS